VTILSATESGALAQWLDDNAYYLPEGSEPMLAEYIEGGSYFLAAKVAEEAALANGEPLSPLQVTYDNPVFAIPIRLATLNSPGEQDMVIYAINELDGQDSGRVGIASYPEFTIPDVCVWGDPSAGDEFNEFYEEHFTKSWTAVGDAGWAVEYAGTWWDCSPCSNVSITEEDLLALGFQGETYNHHLTRIRMRYTPEQADVDLALYGSGIYEPQVTSYADATERNFTCIESFCDGSATPGNEAPDDDGEAGDLLFGGDCGCSAPTAPGSAAPLAILGLALARRRRE
jgi:MYXO-CTERM domain-containing protein